MTSLATKGKDLVREMFINGTHVISASFLSKEIAALKFLSLLPAARQSS